MKRRALLPGGFVLLFALACMTLPAGEPTYLGSSEPRSFPERWIHGGSCQTDPLIQVHAYTDDFYILRQSKCTHYEAPFLYLIFGGEKALLLDTGSVGDPPVADTVQRIMDERREASGGGELELVVVHSHAHFDHVAGDGQFAGRPNTTVVGHGVAQVSEFFGIDEWPEQVVSYDLGERVLEVIPTPGHEASHITLYDPTEEILLTGDTLYPGFLFIFSPADWEVFVASTQRMVDFTSTRPVRWVLGCHVEMQKTPGESYEYRTTYQPNERELQLTLDHLYELDEALANLGQPQRDVHDDFVIFPAWLEWGR